MNKFRKQFYVLFAILLLAGTVVAFNMQSGRVYAADIADTVTLIKNDAYQVEQHTDISEYRQEGSFKAPVLEGNGAEKWIFAGWYTDQACTRALSASVVSPVKEGSYFAKYVRKEVLSVRCQLTEGTTESSENTILRCVSSVDSLKYKSIGMELVTPGGSVKRMQSQNVGTRIQARSDVNLGEYAYSPKAVDAESEYFFSATEKINQADFAKGYMVKPYWVTKDGTCVYGVSKYVTASEGIKRDVVHIPVKMDTAPAENAVFTVNGDSAVYKAYDPDSGYAHLEVKGVPAESVTKYQIQDASGKEVGTYIYRNMGAKDGETAPDISWYSVYQEEGRSSFAIATSAELYGFAALANGGDNFLNKEVYLVADIQINTGNAAEWGTVAPANSWPGIGTDANVRFQGTFDGDGHTISGLYMKTTASYRGMFGSTTGNAVVKNFRLVNSYFESSARGIGSIAGRGVGTFDTIYSDAIVVGSNSSVGGLLGQDAPDGVRMNNCWFAGSVTNNQTDSSIGYGTGGLIGNLQNPSVVTNCLNTGTITADKYNRTPRVGGLIGAVPLATNTGVQISHCVNAGKVAGNGWELGGYGAFTGHIQSGHTGLFNYCYAVRDYDSEFARGYTGRIDTTTSKLVSEDEILGNDAEQKMPGLFTAGNTYWTTMENKMPVLTSFSEYANGAGNTDSLHRWLKNTTSPTVTLRTSQEVHNSAVRVFQQGGYTDGHYFWQAYITEKAYKIDAAGNIVEDIPNNKCKIVKTDLTGVEAPKYSQEFFGGHVNDITYNEKTEQLIVCTMNKDKELIFLDPDTLEETGSRNLTIYINSIDYNETKNQYVVGYVTETNTDETLGTIGASFRRFGIMNPDFTFKEEKFVPKSDTWGYVGQGAACDDEYIYMILSENKSVSLNPIIAVYDWEGNFVNRINLTIPVAADGIGGIQEADFSGVEAENISVVDNTIYIGVAVGNKTTNQRKVMAYSFAR